jgi:hypothetical protein
MHNYSLELDISASDPKLERPEPASGIHANHIMIAPAVDSRLSEIFPSALAVFAPAPLGIRNDAEAQQEQQRSEQVN